MRLIYVTVPRESFEINQNASGARGLANMRVANRELEVRPNEHGRGQRFITLQRILPTTHSGIDVRDWIFVVKKLWVDLQGSFREAKRPVVITLRDGDVRQKPERPGIQRIQRAGLFQLKTRRNKISFDPGEIKAIPAVCVGRILTELDRAFQLALRQRKIPVVEQFNSAQTYMPRTHIVIARHRHQRGMPRR